MCFMLGCHGSHGQRLEDNRLGSEIQVFWGTLVIYNSLH